MSKESYEKYKEIFNRHNFHLNDEQFFEAIKSIEELSKVVTMFNKRLTKRKHANKRAGKRA